MRSPTVLPFLSLIPLVLIGFSDVAGADDDSVAVRLSQDTRGIEQVSRRCFAKLREEGHDAARIPAGEMGNCMRPEIEALAEFAYEVATAYPVSSLTRIALETCTLEQANALVVASKKGGEGDREKLSWRWLSDCLKEVRWLDHDEQTNRLDRARLHAREYD